MRERVLREQPTCAAKGCERASVEDDHIIPWSQREASGITIPQWHARSNHQGLCYTHHAAKTQAEAAAGRARNRQRANLPTERHPGLL